MDDKTTEYAQGVVDGVISAGPWVRLACRRHLDDLEHASERGWLWSAGHASRIYNFIERFIEFSDCRFNLLGWQHFVLGSLFGWVSADTGYRRFQKAYIETGKGSGKTPLVAAVGLYSIVADHESRAEVYLAAQTAEQALVTMLQMCEFVQLSEALREVERLRIYGGIERPRSIIHPRTNSRILRVASEKEGRGKSGPKPSAVIIDEYHEHDSSATLDWLAAGTKNRRQPLVFIITNAGSGLASPCRIEHERACQVVDGRLENDMYFGYVCSLDDGDEPLLDESCWEKVNPGLPLIPGYDYIRKQVADTRGMPGKAAVVNRLNFCIWTGAEEPWLLPAKWRGVEVKRLSEWDRNEVYIALDLSRSGDLTAAALVADMGDGTCEARVVCWMPEESLEMHMRDEHVPYDIYRDGGYLELIDGDFISKSAICDWLGAQIARYNVRSIVYDAWGFDELYNIMRDRGIEVEKDTSYLGSQLVFVPHPQGFGPGRIISDLGRLGMPSSITAVEEVIRRELIKIEYNPLVRLAAEASVVVCDESSNRRFVKKKSRARIDPMIALTMGVGMWYLCHSRGGNIGMQGYWSRCEREGIPMAVAL